MEILVAYDVSTETPEGRRRLWRVAKACEAYCQRVQKSVFECTLNGAQMEQLRYRLQNEMSVAEDSLRIYRLTEPRERYVQVLGRQPEHDLRDPLVL
ncbi:MAG: CRISPR-associated endonuclease Cas2 [Chloroflexota bacterium]|nr:CRISPR-associated endonuclease Cas2 [Chloroflexota bacterium]